MFRRGQAMVETLLAVLIITGLFFALFKLSRMLTGKIMLEHAAMRVARARAVGMNEFMCLKTARIAVIPVAGERLKPGENDERKGMSESALARMYMRTPDSSYADGLLRYKDWDRLSLNPNGSGATRTSMRTEWFDLHGEAEVDGPPIYMNNMGL